MKELKERRSIRKFKQTPIESELLCDFVDCARLAPSAANLQPLKYVAENRPEMNAKIFPLTKWAAYLKGEGTPKTGEEPTAYIAILHDTSISSNYADTDAGAAAMSIIIAAQNKGIASCWLASVDRSAFSVLYNLPENYKIHSVIALGYPAEESHPVEFKGDVKYFRNPDQSLSVPKRALSEVLVSHRRAELNMPYN